MKVPKKTLMLIAVGLLIYLLWSTQRSSYTTAERAYASFGDAAGPGPSPRAAAAPNCNMRAGNGLASALLPREIASKEDFGEFAPADVLSGANFLSARDQIGFPETVGGALRNANQQIRADPPNPKENYVWNNSTIVPDLMQRNLA
jgi:hypothetical protein